MQKTDIEIARNALLNPIVQVGAALNIPEPSIHSYGHYKAKIDYDFINSLEDKKNGKLILVTAISPTGRLACIGTPKS